jgi:hypothetical protein
LARDGGFDVQSLSSTGAATAPLSAATPGFHNDRFSACTFVPVRPAASAYTQTAAPSAGHGSVRSRRPASSLWRRTASSIPGPERSLLSSGVNLGAGTSIKLSIGGAAGTASHLLCDVLGYFI